MADSLNQKKKRGRPKLTDSERKNRHDARKRTERKARVHLGSEIHRWNYIKNRNGLKSDREVATFLIDSLYSYEHRMEQRLTAVPVLTELLNRTTPGPVPVVCTLSASGVSSPETSGGNRNTTVLSTVEEMESEEIAHEKQRDSSTELEVRIKSEPLADCQPEDKTKISPFVHIRGNVHLPGVEEMRPEESVHEIQRDSSTELGVRIKSEPLADPPPEHRTQVSPTTVTHIGTQRNSSAELGVRIKSEPYMNTHQEREIKISPATLAHIRYYACQYKTNNDTILS